MVIDRQRGGIENSVVLVRLVCVCVCVGGWCRPSPAMQCWAVSSNHVPAVGERGLGQRLTTAKESSRSDGEKERRECVRGKSERESRGVCSGTLRSRTQPQCSACSWASTFLLSSLVFPITALIHPLSSSLLSSVIITAFQLSALIAFSSFSFTCTFF